MGIRASNTQPTYDLITGQETSACPPSRDTFRNSARITSGELHRERSVAAEPDIETDKRRQELDALKAEIKKLQSQGAVHVTPKPTGPFAPEK